MKGMYQVQSNWGPDGLSPSAIATRAQTMFDDLEAIAPAPCEWELIDQSVHFPMPEDDDFDEDMIDDLDETLGVPMDQFRAQGEKLVASWVDEDEQDDPIPVSGYQILALDKTAHDEERESQGQHISVRAGSTFANDMEFQWGDYDSGTDVKIITYDRCRNTLESLIRAWPCPWASVHFQIFDRSPMRPVLTSEDAHRVMSEPDNRPDPFVQWIAYLSAPLAKGLITPSALIAEPTPGGGLILSVTKERLDPANPDHRRGAIALAQVLDHILGPGEPFHTRPAARFGPF